MKKNISYWQIVQFSGRKGTNIMANIFNWLLLIFMDGYAALSNSCLCLLFYCA